MNYWYPVEKELVLASRSPRRTEILSMAGVPHTVHPSSIEEFPIEGRPEHIVIHWAEAKARDVASLYSDRPVLGADTMVFKDGVLLGKPSGRSEALRMIGNLSGEWHTVYGGVALAWHSRGLFFSLAEATRVKFRNLSPEEISAYVDSGEPMDKAGAYGIQGLGCVLVEKVEGCYFNVMGLPVSRFLHRFRESLY
ncbi:MAG TPA: Maf family protein [Candidatus Sabulitectum sp.]|nr:Maf family protein [Candidatus Sabulitectum sp.]HRW77771.1 Maf family protein [Candidatus Sabulitectum sp.]